MKEFISFFFLLLQYFTPTACNVDACSSYTTVKNNYGKAREVRLVKGMFLFHRYWLVSRDN